MTARPTRHDPDTVDDQEIGELLVVGSAGFAGGRRPFEEFGEHGAEALRVRSRLLAARGLV